MWLVATMKWEIYISTTHLTCVLCLPTELKFDLWAAMMDNIMKVNDYAMVEMITVWLRHCCNVEGSFQSAWPPFICNYRSIQNSGFGPFMATSTCSVKTSRAKGLQMIWNTLFCIPHINFTNWCAHKTMFEFCLQEYVWSHKETVTLY